jgi:alkanesulfonate monooxygenase SsuD/methylene tetrahydromethanopterin reductase-like flavin-dependent oxidoreductase (luciferase family)
VRIGFQVWGSNVAWGDLMAAAEAIEAAGLHSCFANDHFVPVVGAADGVDPDAAGPIFEAMTTVGGWAARTSRVRLGCLVAGGGYRNPGLLAREVVALDHASGGRMALGIGAGWHARDHAMYGWDLPPIGERLDRLEEQARALRGLLDGERVTIDGRWVRFDDAVLDPPPLQPRLPLLIGGSGEKRTLRIVALYADSWNGEGDAATFARKNAVLDAHCAAVGRDRAAIRRTAGLPPPCIRSTRESALVDLAATFRRHGWSDADAAAAAAAAPCVGTVDDVVAALAGYAAAGAEEVFFDWPAPFDPETLAALAGPVRERLG